MKQSATKVLFSTCGADQADDLARTLVEERVVCEAGWSARDREAVSEQDMAIARAFSSRCERFVEGDHFGTHHDAA